MQYQKILCQNTVTGEAVALTDYVQGSGYLIQQYEPGTIDGRYKTEQGSGQDGLKVNSRSLGVRTMQAKIMMMADTLERVANLKDAADRVFNPVDPIEITVFPQDESGRMPLKITALATQTADSAIDAKNSNRYLQQMIISLTAHNPLFTQPEYNLVKLTSWEGGLRFPFKLPFKLAHRGAPTVGIINRGHVATPVIIKFKGPAKYPRIDNLTTGEYLLINRELSDGQTLIINTEYLKESVIIDTNGVQTNGYGYLDIHSTFDFALAVGDNTLRYSSFQANLVNDVQILYKERFLAV